MRVTRTIVYEGEEEWIEKTLEKSLLRKRGLKYKTPFGFIVMTIEEVENGSDKRGGKRVKSQDEGEKWAKEAATTLIEVNKVIKELEGKMEEECEPFKAQIKEINSKYAFELGGLRDIDTKMREKVMEEYEGIESIPGREGGKLTFSERWGYEVREFAKVPKELRIEAVDDKAIKKQIKEGIRNIKGIEIKQIRSLRVYTSEQNASVEAC